VLIKQQRHWRPIRLEQPAGGVRVISPANDACPSAATTRVAATLPGGEACTAAPWFALYTSARAEKKVDWILKRQQVDSFVPVVPLERQWHDRRKVVDWPLFPSYVFARFPLSKLYTVLATPGIAFMVTCNGRPAPIAHQEIANIAAFARALARGGSLPTPVSFEAGERVRIAAGPFAGVEGVVLEQRGRRRVLVGLTTIRLGFEVDVPSDQVQRIR